MLAKSGLYLINKDGRYHLMFGGEDVGSFRVRKNKLGVIIDGGKLSIDGVNFASSMLAHPSVVDVDGSVYFGETPLVVNGKCINITAEDYSDLIGGNAVAGYAKYNLSNIYNIVDDVATADEITYTVEDGVITFDTAVIANRSDGMVYGNISGVMANNVEDMSSTVDNIDAPFVSVRYFEQVVIEGEHIDLTYHVDTQDMFKTNYDIVGNTFTVEVETASGSVVKRTTYAGVFTISTPSFSVPGETWFSIRCVDSRGVSSVVQYFDVLVKTQAQMENNFYKMSAENLEEYGIIPNDTNVDTAHANKAALSSFFESVKEDGYNGVEMYNNKGDNNGDGTIYWIDYHDVFGSSRFFLCEISSNVILSVTELTLQQVIDGGYDTVRITNIPKVGDSYETSSTRKVFVNNTASSGGDIVFPSHFTVDLNGSTIAATPSDDLSDGCLVRFKKTNVDTHIVNGKIRGNYQGYNFDAAAKKIGHDNPSEYLHVVGTVAARFCSFERLDISNSVGYDCQTLSKYATNYLVPTFSVGGIKPQTGEVDSSKTDMVVSNVMNIDSHYMSLGEVALSKFGKAGYWGNSRMYFMSFYDNSCTHVKTVKSKMFYAVKIPFGATKVRVSGYGTLAQWNVANGIGPFVMLHERTKGIKIRDCHWHDTRTAVIGGGEVSGKSYENCTFLNVAAQSDKYKITQILGDMEDSWQWTRFYQIKNCKYLGGVNNTLKIMYCNTLDFEGNEGIHVWQIGGLEDGFFYNNRRIWLEMDRNWRCYHPHVLYDGNQLTALTIGDNNLELPLVMSNTDIRDKSYYAKLVIKNGTNGDVQFD